MHTADRQVGVWMARPEEIAGLTPDQIRDKFALPTLPTHISEVRIPAGSHLQVGTVAPQEGWGEGGGTQYQSLDKNPDEDWFSEPKLISEYNLQKAAGIGGTK